MKLSVLICVYNTEREYFEKCLRSITHSTLRDYEICVVDDGSCVDYSDLVEAYGLKYVKTENRGILAARLECIDMADGEYSVFVDSDDTVSFDFHQPMVERADEVGADIVMNDWAFHTDRARYFCRNDSSIATDVSAEGADVILRFLAQEGREHSYFVLWNKIYRTKLLRYAKDEVKATEIGRSRSVYAEDALLNFFAHKKANRLANVHTGYYFYRIHAAQSVNVVSREKLLLQIALMGKTLDIMEANIPDCDAKAGMLRYLQAWRELMSRTHYSHAVGAGYADLFDVIKNVYRVEKLAKSTLRDQSVYVNNCLLASNFEDIDEVLLSIWRDPAPSAVRYDKRDGYVKRCLARMSSLGKSISYSKDAKTVIPCRIISTRDKIVHNRFIYMLGLILFKKGSKLRAFLKKKL